MSIFILRFSFHNSPLSLCFTSIAELCGSLEFRPALSPNIDITVQHFYYTPFGEQIPCKVSDFCYNAEDYDTATGMVNLRLRQYEPVCGVEDSARRTL